jgi:hypothetical protein
MSPERGRPFYLNTSQSDFQGELLSYTIPTHWPQGDSFSMLQQQSIGTFLLHK